MAGCPGKQLLEAGCPDQDSDGDSIPDSRDQCPTVPAPGTADGCPPQTPAVVSASKKPVLEGVNFEYNQATLLPEAMAILDMAAATLKEWGHVKVEVAGHTDSMGSDDFNLKLSQRRAEAVRDYLVSKGIADRLVEKGYGESNPVADNDTEEGRYKNVASN